MTPEQMTDRLKAACGANLRAVLLYGSAAAGDHAGRRSDFNLLVVVDRLGVSDLDALAPVVEPWVAAGNPPPLFFTGNGLQRSADVFPIEVADLQIARRVLYGEDVAAGLKVDVAGLRHQLERELKSKLLLLRQEYLLTGGRAAEVGTLLAGSVVTFLVLFRATLRLFQPEVPRAKAEALDLLARYITFDSEAFRRVLDLKEGRIRGRDLDMSALFARYLSAIESVVESVDAQMRREG
jgi:predicted nucleotidyltransferase